MFLPVSGPAPGETMSQPHPAWSFRPGPKAAEKAAKMEELKVGRGLKPSTSQRDPGVSAMPRTVRHCPPHSADLLPAAGNRWDPGGTASDSPPPHLPHQRLRWLETSGPFGTRKRKRRGC